MDGDRAVLPVSGRGVGIGAEQSRADITGQTQHNMHRSTEMLVKGIYSYPLICI
jgi:hypothetical protein